MAGKITKTRSRELMDMLGSGYVRKGPDIYKVKTTRFFGLRIDIRGEWLCTVYQNHVKMKDEVMAAKIAEAGFDVTLKGL